MRVRVQVALVEPMIVPETLKPFVVGLAATVAPVEMHMPVTIWPALGAGDRVVKVKAVVLAMVAVMVLKTVAPVLDMYLPATQFVHTEARVDDHVP